MDPNLWRVQPLRAPAFGPTGAGWVAVGDEDFVGSSAVPLPLVRHALSRAPLPIPVLVPAARPLRHPRWCSTAYEGVEEVHH